jgi:hypothetical protein
MNVADLELCKQLHDLSRWEDAEKCWYKVNRATHKSGEWEDLGGAPEFKALNVEQVPTYNWETRRDTSCHTEYVSPAYDLGYLLRKLQGQKRASVSRLLSRNMWVASCVGITKNCEAANPEDAAAKLAIELFKQGILTR